MIQFYPPVELAARLESYRAAHRVTAAQLILTAVEATHERLPSILKAAEQPATEPSLFSGSHVSTPPASADTRQTGVRLLSEDIATIDHLASTTAAKSRSAYLVAALETFFADIDQASAAPSLSAPVH